MMRKRRNEQIGGGYFVLARGARTGRIKTGHIMRGAVPFEHPNSRSAIREAKRLSAKQGREFFVLSQVTSSKVDHEFGGYCVTTVSRKPIFKRICRMLRRLALDGVWIVRTEWTEPTYTTREPTVDEVAQWRAEDIANEQAAIAKATGGANA